MQSQVHHCSLLLLQDCEAGDALCQARHCSKYNCVSKKTIKCVAIVPYAQATDYEAGAMWNAPYNEAQRAECAYVANACRNVGIIY